VPPDIVALPLAPVDVLAPRRPPDVAVEQGALAACHTRLVAEREARSVVRLGPPAVAGLGSQPDRPGAPRYRARGLEVPGAAARLHTVVDEGAVGILLRHRARRDPQAERRMRSEARLARKPIRGRHERVAESLGTVL